jgi:hypothetical protein
MAYKLSFTVSILVCKSLNGKTCQYSNNTFQKRQKSFSFVKLNSQTCKGPHRPDAVRQRDANFQFSKTNKRIKILQGMQTKWLKLLSCPEYLKNNEKY